MKRIGIGTIAWCLATLSGCTLFGHSQPPRPPADPNAKYRELDVARLVDYGGAVASMTEPSRKQECLHLGELAEHDHSLPVRLHLATLQSVSADCGAVEQALDTLGTAKAEIQDPLLRSWVHYQEQLLNRLRLEASFRKEMELKAKHASEKAQRSQRQAKSKESELKTLKDKLDALKSIEQSPSVESPQGEH